MKDQQENKPDAKRSWSNPTPGESPANERSIPEEMRNINPDTPRKTEKKPREIPNLGDLGKFEQEQGEHLNQPHFGTRIDEPYRDPLGADDSIPDTGEDDGLDLQDDKYQ